MGRAVGLQQQQDQRASRKRPSALTAVNLVEFVSLLLSG